MNKWKLALLSLVIALLFGIVSYFIPDQINLFWSFVISVLTFIISYVFVELIAYSKKIDDIAVNSEYKFFKECGISEYHKDFSELDFTPCIAGANRIKVMLLYSNRFVTSYINALRDFVAREGTALEIILLSNNKNSNSFKYISTKFGYSEDKLNDKLMEFIKILHDDLLPHKSTKSTVELYFTDLIPTYSLYMFNDYAYITLYKTAPQRTTLVPCFRIEKAYDSSFFNFMENDFVETKGRGKLQKI